jgi:23S rRNA (cytidine1920-2'-O)/16S rRNA (cytidine1409-2'-O)-methyltransferase
VSARKRLDAELVRRGLASSRSHAVELVEQGKVTVGGAPALNASRQVAIGDAVTVLGPPPKFVGRGGHKLDAALDRFDIDVTGCRAIDVGASTGGFTDCLLQRGASSVVALDVGHGQLHEKLRADERVDVRERMNVRDADLSELGGEPFDIVVVDVSFISLRTIAPALISLSRPGTELVALIKPQFEAGRQEASKGRGVIKSPEVWRQAIDGAVAALREQKAATMDVMVSPVLGAEGNVEFLGWFEVGAGAPKAIEFDLDAVIAEATQLSLTGAG